MFTTSDLMTYVIHYNKAVARALRTQCRLGVIEYRSLAYLSDHVGGVAPKQLADVLETSPANITITGKSLINGGYIDRIEESKGVKLIITRGGINALLDADEVLSQVHEEYFSVLAPARKQLIDGGSMIANKNSAEGNRLREGHFFPAFETLHAFLV